MKLRRIHIRRVNSLIEEGYELQDEDVGEACNVWLEAWKIIRQMAVSVEELDRMPFDYCISVWLDDLDMALHNAGMDDKSYLYKRLEFLKELMEIESNPKFMRSEAETYFYLGEIEKSKEKFEELIRRYPCYFWGYIGYGDLLYEIGDSRAEELYTKAIEFADEDEMDVVHERFSQLYDNAEEKVMEIINKIANPERLEKYRTYRKTLADILSRVADNIEDEMINSAKMLGIARGRTVVLKDEDETQAFWDFVLFEYRKDGKSMVEAYGKAENDAEAEVLEGVFSSYTSLFRIICTSKLKYEVELEDLLNGGRVKIVNINLSKTARPGLLFFTRIIPLEFNINQGGFLFDERYERQIMKKYRKLVNKLDYDESTARYMAFFKLNRTYGYTIEYRDVIGEEEGG
jgi:tetratricopeptide (TPR) repeat protein